jgi:hypothetical protein
MTARYAPPKSKVEDVIAERPRLLVRTRWLYLASTAVLLVLGYFLLEQFAEDVSLLTLSGAFALTALLSVVPVQMLATLSEASLPLWWNALFYSVIGLLFAGLQMEDGTTALVGFLALLASCAVIFVACWIVETRKGVRMYSRTNSLVIVPHR